MNRILNWALNLSPQHQVLVVRYEDLKQDTMKEVERMVTFLGLPFNEEAVTQRLAEDFTVFKRLHKQEDDFKRYTDDQTVHMRSVVLKAIKLVKDKNMAHIIRLNDYLKK